MLITISMFSHAYLTKLGPSNSKHSVAKNNFDGYRKRWNRKIKDGKTDVVFEMKLPKKKVQNHSRELKRDVHLHRGTFNVFPPYDFPSVTFYCLSFRFKGSVGLITCLEEYL
jgi:hypothetical protein